MVRAYSFAGGRTRPAVDAGLDLITSLVVDRCADPGHHLDEAHLALLDLCRAGPLSVAELASEADLAVGVVRVLLGDLLRDGHLRAVPPVPTARRPDAGLLREVVDGLRAL